MGAFHEIQDTIQRITEAIASVIGIDVTVIDENLERVAGTGEMRL
jgi:sigma-54 dependent transcriptional regulator, acetoin dehydrogenase operon transcriptional activator AcoR